MKKFQFHLEKLLSYKGQMLDSEMMTLAVLNEEMKVSQEKLLALQADLDCCCRELEDKMLQKTTPAACQLHVRYKEHLKLQIKQMEKEIAKLSLRIDNQIDTIKNLKLETKSLETIKSSRYDEYKKEDLKAAELQVEEFVSTAKMMIRSF
ncbi:flagellar FliJ family protein [Sinanaerobacter chloroacetimidivorans]|jgi:flagellar export protein FliJ|uniref:Flagellar FliJ family protein n=1 Tax=Sinanaerobacter chloroacetimidivorans TaxID=2818044 RepID=A0A8J8B1A5_9FIRM|nr:flagellar FliJ family protein [Sinanaerobacter chloroacetimidivorans]MBR0597532.1 flagellar FliJ family protein [Sinanaerobacter chloroacetimidivorans]